MARRLAIVALWLLVWQLLALALGNSILLAGPVEVATALARGLVTPAFWGAVVFSMARIAGGFALAALTGLALGVLGARVPLVADVLRPLVSCMKSVPVACVIVVLLVWMGSAGVSVVVVFCVAFPVVYFAALEGYAQLNVGIGEMLSVFGIRGARRFFAFVWPGMLPYLMPAASVAVGLAWKSGVAAEVIGVPGGSIGEALYLAKLTLETADVLAWTVAIVALSAACEKALLTALAASARGSRALALRLARGGDRGTVPVSGFAGEELRVEGVSKAFGQVSVLEGASLSAPRGSRVRVTGASGVGKTTLLRIVAGLEVADAGEVRGAGRVGMAFQEGRFFEDASAVENVALVGAFGGDEAVAREHLARLLPPECLGQPVSTLSGGQRRRVDVVRALGAECEVVILDEPFAGLDDAAASACARYIASELGERTLLLASHASAALHELDLQEWSIEAE